MLKHFTLIAWLVSLSLMGWTQLPEVIKYREKDGLSSLRSNLKIYQDTEKYIWICSIEGLYRYDGTEFIQFHINQAPEFIPVQISQTPKGKIWVVSANGHLAYFKDNEFHFYPLSEDITQLIKNRQVQQFEIDESGNFYFATSKFGLLKVDSSGVMDHIISPRKGSGLGIWFSDKLPPMAFGLAMPGEMVLADSILWFDEHHTCFEKIYFDFENQNPEYMPSIWQDLGHDLAVTFGDFVFKISKKEGLVASAQVPDFVTSISIDDRGNWIVGTIFHGIIVFPNGNLDITQSRTYFEGKHVITSIVDADGNIWLSVLQEGVWQIPALNILRYQKDNSHLKTNTLKHFFSTDDSLYVSTNENRIYLVKNDTFTNVTLFDMNKGPQRGLFSRAYNDRATDRIYMAYGPRIGYLSKSKFVELNMPLAKKNANANFASFTSDGKGGVWVFGRTGGVHFINDKPAEMAFKKGAFISTSTTFKNKIYVGGARGMQALDGQTFVDIEHPHPIFKSQISSFCPHNGKLWISSKPLGVAYWEEDSLHLLSEKYDLYDVWKLKEDHDTIWGLNNHHLVKIVDGSNSPLDIKKYWVNFSKDLIYKDFILYQDTFYLSSNEGLVTIPKKDLNDLQAIPSSTINTVQIHGNDTLVKSNYELDYTQNMIQIGFNGVHFGSPERTYKYKMSGVDHEWKYTANNTIQYTKLTPGFYEFEVYTISSEGLMSENPARLSFTISPPYWATWWFRLSVAVIIIGLIVFLVRRRFKQLLRQREIDRKLYKLESQALRSQMNPHFIFNILSVIQGYVMKGDVDASEAYLNKFARLVRLILENSREDYVLLGSEIEMLKSYMDMEKMRF